jgi:hypothetical protein
MFSEAHEWRCRHGNAKVNPGMIIGIKVGSLSRYKKTLKHCKANLKANGLEITSTKHNGNGGF